MTRSATLLPGSVALTCVVALFAIADAGSGVVGAVAAGCVLALSVGTVQVARTQARGQERALAAAQRRYRRLVDGLPDAVAELDAAGTVSEASPACLHVLGLSPHDLIGRRPADLVAAEDAGATASRIGELLAGVSTQARWEARGASSIDARWLEFTGTGLLEEGRAGVLLTVRDVTALRQTQDEQARAAAHDELTGLKTRAEFLRLASLASAAARPRQPVAVLVCDLDGFSGVNEVYGRAAGDEVLRAVAARLRRALRPQDVVGRLGGDEFGVLPSGQVTPDGAALVAGRLQAAVSPAITLRGGDAVRIGMRVDVHLLTAPVAGTDDVIPSAAPLFAAPLSAAPLSAAPLSAPDLLDA